MGRKQARFCSLACGNRARSGERRIGFYRVPLDQRADNRPSTLVYFPTCHCGTQFTARSISATLCSDLCEIQSKGERVCACGEAFLPVKKWQKSCSDLCARRRSEEGKKKNHKKVRARLRAAYAWDRGKPRKRARKFGVEYEPVQLGKVLERDGWKCGICGKKISKKSVYPHPMSPSLDHVIPMSRGGGHLYANVQAAHFVCNTLKGNGSAGEQLLLVG